MIIGAMFSTIGVGGVFRSQDFYQFLLSLFFIMLAILIVITLSYLNGIFKGPLYCVTIHQLNI